MSELYLHQCEGIAFLSKRPAALLADEQGTGKTRQALVAAFGLWNVKIDRMLVICPAAVRYSWRTEIEKLNEKSQKFVVCEYKPEDQKVYVTGKDEGLPVVLISYGLLPQQRHLDALKKWCQAGATLLVCDEASFLKSRSAKQTRGAKTISSECQYCWLLTGTPVANSPLDLWGQALVMSDGRKGPLNSFKSFYHFRARYAVLKLMNMGQVRFQQVVGYQNLPELTKRFAPYVLRREKKDCLDLPEKSYTVREVAVSEATWRIYQELRKEALLALPDAEVRPEPNAAVRILRLCQLTSGHVGSAYVGSNPSGDSPELNAGEVKDVSSEKLDYITDAILNGELSNEKAIILWTRWRRERIRLREKLAGKIETFGIFGGQQEKNRSCEIQGFQTSDKRRVLVAQPHSGGFGLNLTAASVAVYLSNDFSFTTRIQSEDRTHRIGQRNPCLYIDVVAVGPKGQRTVDAHVLDCLRAKKDLAQMTCSGWRRILSEDENSSK